MTKERSNPPGNLQGLERWINEWAREEQLNAGRLRRRIGLLVLSAMLRNGTSDEPRFVLKGGAAFELRFGQRARGSADIDAIFAGNMNEAIDVLRSAGERGWSGFKGAVVDRGSFEVPGVTVAPRRAVLKLAYHGKPFVSLPIEVAAPEGDALDAIDIIEVRPLVERGLGGPTAVALLGAPYQIAQKLHACTSPDSDGRVNDRARDLADILLLDELAAVDLSATKRACLQVFALRAMHPWPPTIVVRPLWPQLWEAIVRDDAFPIDDILKAARLVQALIARIDAAEIG